MITGGIDVGLENIHIVIRSDEKILAKTTGPSGGGERPQAIRRLWAEALKIAGLEDADIAEIVVTGKGKFDADFAGDRVTEGVAAARAAAFLLPGATMIVDVGADETLVVSLKDGHTEKTLINQKCAAGLGLFLEYMAWRLEMRIEEMGDLELSFDTPVSDRCVAYAELDALGLLNRGVPAEAVALAVTDAAAVRACTAIHDITFPRTDAVLLCGGVANNKAFVRALEKHAGITFSVPEDPEYIGALGAAVFAAEKS